MTNPLTQDELINRLLTAADEIAAAGHNGWGNVCRDAAQLIQERQAVNATSLVAQALEKAAGLVEKYTHDELNGKNTAALIRALIAKPIEQVSKSQKPTAPGGVAVYQIRHDLKWVDVGEERYNLEPEHSRRILYTHLPAAAVDELVEALERISGLTISQFAGPNDMAAECKDIARQALSKVKGDA